MIMFGTMVGRMLRWLDRWTEDAYGAYLFARWPDKYTDPKDEKR